MEVGRVLVISDSVANIPADLCASLGIVVVPLFVQIGEESYKDGIDIRPEEVYQKMRADRTVVPTTSQASPQQFLEALEKGVGEDKDVEAIVVYTLSHYLSSTVQSAHIAKEAFTAKHPEIQVEVVDTLSAAMGQGWLVIEAGRLAKRGANLDEILKETESLRDKIRIYAVVDTLEYLYKSGRVGRASQFMGALLNIKPIITIQKDGVVDGIVRVRSRLKGLNWMKDEIRRSQHEAGRLHISVIHAGEEEAARAFMQQIESEFPCEEVFITSFTPVMGVHTGPGLIGVAFFTQ